MESRTEIFYIKKDCAYTYITIPNQVVEHNTSPGAHKPLFIFKINENLQINLPLSIDLEFVYNAKFLTHRQEYTQRFEQCRAKFYNIPSYANEKLFNHLRASFARSM